ncbi:unnamed protein product, partial [marine sediment metagenome]
PKTTKIFKKHWKELVDLSENGFIRTSERGEYVIHQWMKIVLKLAEELLNYQIIWVSSY